MEATFYDKKTVMVKWGIIWWIKIRASLVTRGVESHMASEWRLLAMRRLFQESYIV